MLDEAAIKSNPNDAKILNNVTSSAQRLVIMSIANSVSPPAVIIASFVIDRAIFNSASLIIFSEKFPTYQNMV